MPAWAHAAPPGVRRCSSSRGTAAAILVYERFFREEPAPYFASDEDHFLFGSVGTEAAEGRAVLALAGAAARLSGSAAGARRLRRRSGSSRRTATSCRSACRRSPSAFRASASTARCATRPATARGRTSRRRSSPRPPRIRRRRSSTSGSCSDAAADPRFNADTLLAEISRNTRLSLIDRLLYRFAIIPAARRALLQQRDSQDGWMRSRPDWGRGRIDPFNPVKFRMLAPADRRHHRQLRHGAGVGAWRGATARPTTGTA